MTERLRCQLVTLEEVYELSFRLAMAVRASGFKPDLVVAISRGGYAPARFLCDFLNLFNLTSIRVQHYTRAAEHGETAYVKYPLCTDIAGQRVLVVDDVNDTGETLRVAGAHLKGFAPTEVRSAVLHEKTSSPLRADYAVETLTEWRWIIYPWAVVEDVGGFLKQMRPAPTDATDAARRLRADYDLALPPRQLELLLELLSQEPPP